MTSMKNAFERATAAYTQNLTPEECACIQVPTTLEDLVSQAQSMANVLSQNNKGRLITIGEKAAQLEVFERLVEGLCKTSPAMGELIWGSVSFTLQMVKSNAKAFLEVVEFFQTMADEIGSIRVQENTFRNSPLVQNVVEALYSAMLSFWVEAVKYYHSKQRGFGSRLKLFTSSSSIEKKFQLLVGEIAKQKARLHDASNVQHNADFAAFHDAANHRRLRDWLNAPNYEADFRAAIDRRYEGTCEWIMKNPAFVEWTSSTAKPSIFIRGIPGSGKTILSAWFIQTTLDEKTDNDLILYHYFKDTDTDRRTSLSAVRSLLDQLFRHFRRRQHPSLSHLERELTDMSNDRMHPDFVDLWEIFSSTILNFIQAQAAAAPMTTIVMDAMDECADSDLLVTRILNLALQHSGRLKILVTGRESAWNFIDTFLPNYPIRPLELEITPDDVQHDISSFVRSTIFGIPRLANRERLRDRLSNELGKVEHHQGMFLWAYFVCEEAKRQGDERELWKLLDHLPKGLPAVYDRICKRIVESNESTARLSLSVLQWIVNSPRPLSFAELEQGLRLMRPQTTLTTFVQSDGESGLLWSSQDIVDACGNLITYSGANNGDSFKLVHLSVAKFFRTAGLEQLRLPLVHPLPETSKAFAEVVQNSTPILGQLCLKYLISDAVHDDTHPGELKNMSTGTALVTPTSDEEGSSTRHPFFHFAAVHWPDFILHCFRMPGCSTLNEHELLSALNLTAFITDSSKVIMWLEHFICQLSFEIALHTICQFLEQTNLPVFTSWVQETTMCLKIFTQTLSRKPELIKKCYPSKSHIGVRSWQLVYDAATGASVTASEFSAPLNAFPGWIHYNSKEDLLLYIDDHSDVMGLKGRFMRTGIPMRPAIVQAHTNITGVVSTNGPATIYQPNPELGVEQLCFSGNGEHVARVNSNYIDTAIEVLDTHKGATVFFTKSFSSSNIHTLAMSYSGQKLIVLETLNFCQLFNVFCLVVANGCTITLEINPHMYYSLTCPRFTSDEETFLAFLGDAVCVWRFQRDVDGHPSGNYLVAGGMLFCVIGSNVSVVGPEAVDEKPHPPILLPFKVEDILAVALSVDDQRVACLHFTSDEAIALTVFDIDEESLSRQATLHITPLITPVRHGFARHRHEYYLCINDANLVSFQVALTYKITKLESFLYTTVAGRTLVFNMDNRELVLKTTINTYTASLEIEAFYVHSPYIIQMRAEPFTGSLLLRRKLIGLKNGHHFRKICVVPDKVFTGSSHPDRSHHIYLVWPEDEDCELLVIIATPGQPIVIETTIKSGDVMKDDAWTYAPESGKILGIDPWKDDGADTGDGNGSDDEGRTHGNEE
ncbi:hypothetical protein H0H87_002634 [Tephrocybe sp. NHM501043]|nr:hypothetical protein H0H87_002634 [Tephrocybe sp. NHM501043]